MPQHKQQINGDAPGQPLTARLAAKRALRASEARYRALVAASAHVVWITTPEGLLDEAAEWGALTGQSPEQSRGMGWAEALHPDDRPRVLRLWAEAVRLRRTFETEYRLRMRDGSYRLFASRGVPVFDDRGAVREWIGTSVDVTERRQAEDERLQLLARERQARAAAEAAERRQAALAEVVRIFSQSPLDLTLTLHQIAYHCAELLADCCLVYLLPDGRSGARTVVFPEPQVYRIDQSLIDGVLAAGQPLLMPALPAPPEGGPALRSLMIVPLRAQGRVFGVLAVGRIQPGQPYTFEEQVFLGALADRAAQALDRALLYAVEQRARAAAERAAERLSRLQTITAVLADALTPPAIAEVVLEQCLQEFRASSGVFSMVSADGQRIEAIHTLSSPEASAQPWTSVPIEPGQPFPDSILRGATLFFETPAQLHSAYPCLAQARVGEAAWVLAPFLVDGHPLGGMVLAFAAPRHFSDDDRSFIQAVAQQCCQALSRAHLYGAEQRARLAIEQTADRLTRLQRVTSALSRALTPEQVAEVIVAEGVAALDADAGLVALLDQDGQRMEITAAAGYPPDEIARYRTFQITDNLPLAQVTRSSEPIWWEQGVAMVERYPLLKEFSPAHRPNAFVGLPLHLDGRVIGVFALRFGPQRSFTPEERSLMLTLAQQGAQALERARLHRAAEEAVRMRDVFFSIAAHELKSPLTALLGQAQLLQRRATRESVLAEREVRTLATLVAQAHRLNKLVLAMLDISRIEQGQLALERDRLDLAELARRVAEELQPSLEHHALRLDLPGAPLPICGDALRLEQVLQNLLNNAVKYSPEGGPVELRLWSEGGHAAVAVRDYGIGIPQAAIPHLFTRFYRAANIEARNISGMGIGLYVVREIVELHGGSIGVESAEGQGSVFTVWLPLISDA